MSKSLYYKEFANIPHSSYDFKGDVTIAVLENGDKVIYINGVSYNLDELVYGDNMPDKLFELGDLQNVKVLKGTKNMFWPNGLLGCDQSSIGSKAVKKEDGSWDMVNSLGNVYKNLSEESILYSLNNGQLKIFE